MNVTKQKDSLVVSFQFDPYIVSMMGTVEGRKYDPASKNWLVPVAQVLSLVDMLGKFGFTFSDDVIKLYKERILFSKKIDRIKAGEFKASELELLASLELPFYLYQKQGAGFMTVAEASLLGDQPGLGKTLQSIATTRIKKSKKILVFCPMSVKKTWQEEIEKWNPEATSVVVGGTPKQRQEQWLQDVNYYICNYHLLQRDLKIMRSVYWDHVIADEATNISNPRSQTAKNLKKIRAKNKIALTGPPLATVWRTYGQSWTGCSQGCLVPTGNSWRSIV